MKRQIQIKQRQGTKSPQDYLEMVFKKDNEEWVFTKNKQIVKKRDLLPSDETMVMKISWQNPNYIVKFEDSEDYRETQNDIYRKLAELLPYQRNIRKIDSIDENGVYKYSDFVNPNLSVHLFDFIDQTSIHIENVAMVKNMLRASNIINNMSHSERCEVMYHYGYNPKGKKPSEVFMFLIEPGNGMILRRDRYDTKRVGNQEISRSYLEYFLDRYTVGDEDIYLQTLVLKAAIIKKADKTNILERKATGHYFLNDNNIGLSIHNVIDYLKNHKRDLDYIKDQVMRNDSIAEDDIQDLLNRKGIKEERGLVTELSKEQLQQNEFFQRQSSLLKKCRDVFKMSVSDEEGIESLEMKVEEGRKLFQRAQLLGIKKLVESNPMWDFNRIKEEVVKAGEARKVHLTKVAAEKKIKKAALKEARLKKLAEVE